MSGVGPEPEFVESIAHDPERLQPPPPTRQPVDTQARLVERVIHSAEADGDEHWTAHQLVRRRRGI